MSISSFLSFCKVHALQERWKWTNPQKEKENRWNRELVGHIPPPLNFLFFLGGCDVYHKHARLIPFASITRLWWMMQGQRVHTAILEPELSLFHRGSLRYLPSFCWWRSYPQESEGESEHGEVMQTTLTQVDIMETTQFWCSAGLMDVSPGLGQECTQALLPAVWCHLSSVPRER